MDTAALKSEHLSSPTGLCPVCKVEKVDCYDSTLVNRSNDDYVAYEVHVSCKCTECNASWIDVYRRIDVIDLAVPSKN